MLLFGSGVKTFIFLKRDGLELHAKSSLPQQLRFPETLVKHEEILNKDELEKLLANFFGRMKRVPIGVILHDDVVYSKEFIAPPKQKLKPPQEEIQKFLDIVPFPKQNIARVDVVTNKKATVFVTNRELYEEVVNFLLKGNFHTKFVLPMAVITPFLKGPPSYETFSKACSNEKRVEKANFLKSAPEKQNKSFENDQEAPTEETEEKKSNVKQIVLLLISLLFLIAAGAYGAYSFGLIGSKKAPVASKISPTPSAKKSDLTPAPQANTSAKLTREQVKIQVLNGSGVAGQATLVKDKLTELGFTNIETGNAEGAVSNATIVIFASRAAEFKNIIMPELKKIFPNMDTHDIASSDPFDITITTGSSTP